ncbi:hypothetical protein [Bradyrhizobium sp. CCBAU 51765]|uniref:hypothetical protein n=1 Tax=Bradyrhizobium sp. CCBAU 51765 TaxID=1325102 RepID=UPI001FED5D0E|nr:hypothetical protein [Bradyrhizobium sp. CCBAU 51765]
MTFDPFGDFATRGYLRNVAKAKDPEIVQRLLHNSFLTGIDASLDHLKAQYEAQEVKRKGGQGLQ